MAAKRKVPNTREEALKKALREMELGIELARDDDGKPV